METQTDKVRQLLLLNFGPGNMYGRPVLADPENMTTEQMAQVVLEHCMRWKERAEAAEAFISEKVTFRSNLLKEVETYHRWRTIKQNHELRPEFKAAQTGK